MKNEGKNAKHGFKIMTAVITVCAVLCTVVFRDVTCAAV